MANHKSAEKRNRQNIKRNLANREARAALRLNVKRARTAAKEKDSKAKELVLAAEKALAKAATKGLVHTSMAARSTSRLYRLLAQA